MSEEQPLQVARCTKIIQDENDPEKSKYVINVKQIAKFVVNLGDRVSPTDIEEGMRVGYVIHYQPYGLYFGLILDYC
jgi:26S proteasome regulatory subunit T1